MSRKHQKKSKSIAILTSLLFISACATTNEKDNLETAQNNDAPTVVQAEPTNNTAIIAILDQLKNQTTSTSTQTTLIKVDDQNLIEVTLRDGSFRSGSSKLNPTELTRLTPILNTLNLYPSTYVQI
jgi:outer membrane protein OmpA-like peptidoglycan-associated protein